MNQYFTEAEKQLLNILLKKELEECVETDKHCDKYYRQTTPPEGGWRTKWTRQLIDKINNLEQEKQ